MSNDDGEVWVETPDGPPLIGDVHRLYTEADLAKHGREEAARALREAARLYGANMLPEYRFVVAWLNGITEEVES